MRDSLMPSFPSPLLSWSDWAGRPGADIWENIFSIFYYIYIHIEREMI